MKGLWTAGAVLAAMVLLTAAGSAEASWGSWLGCGDECGTTRAELMKLQCVAEATQGRGWVALAGYLQQEKLPDEACPLLKEKLAELRTPSRFTAWIDGVCGEHTAADLADHLEEITDGIEGMFQCSLALKSGWESNTIYYSVEASDPERAKPGSAEMSAGRRKLIDDENLRTSRDVVMTGIELRNSDGLKGDLYSESVGLVPLKHGMTRAELLKFQCVVGATWDREWDVLVGHLQQEDISGEACSILEEKIAELKALNPYDSWVAEACGGHAASIAADHLEAVANSPTVKWHCASGELIESISADRDDMIERISAE